MKRRLEDRPGDRWKVTQVDELSTPTPDGSVGAILLVREDGMEKRYSVKPAELTGILKVGRVADALGKELVYTEHDQGCGLVLAEG